MDTFWLIHKITVDVFIFVIFLINLSNLISLKKLENSQDPNSNPTVSICIPVRDEEKNIQKCLKSILAQNYPNYEVLVLYDDGDHASELILKRLQEKFKNFKIIKGKTLPDGWIGKHWACQQMSEVAEGELILFTDADTRHHPDCLKNAVFLFLSQGADLLTAIPKEEVKTFGEKLIIPIILWSIHCFYPVALAHRLKRPGLSLTIGQYMLFRSSSYNKIGGHAAVKDQIVDDIMMGRKIITEGFKWRLFDGTNRITCRMYANFRESFEGFSRGFLPNFDYNYVLLFFVWLWLIVVFIEPIVVLVVHFFISPVDNITIYLTIYEISISLLIWSIVYVRFKFPFYMIFLYPITIIISWLISLNSIYIHARNDVKWKGRKMPKRNK